MHLRDLLRVLLEEHSEWIAQLPIETLPLKPLENMNAEDIFHRSLQPWDQRTLNIEPLILQQEVFDTNYHNAQAMEEARAQKSISIANYER